jgi:hypothetical protein
MVPFGFAQGQGRHLIKNEQNLSQPLFAHAFLLIFASNYPPYDYVETESNFIDLDIRDRYQFRGRGSNNQTVTADTAHCRWFVHLAASECGEQHRNF